MNKSVVFYGVISAVILLGIVGSRVSSSKAEAARRQELAHLADVTTSDVANAFNFADFPDDVGAFERSFTSAQSGIYMYVPLARTKTEIEFGEFLIAKLQQAEACRRFSTSSSIETRRHNPSCDVEAKAIYAAGDKAAAAILNDR